MSVETSNSTSSAATASPTCLNHLVMVPSVTVSPSWGMVMSIATVCSFLGAQPCKPRPVSDRTVSPKSSDNEGWGWMKAATSSTVASQFTAR